MELLARLERRFGATIPETVMANAETARELLPALLAGDRRRRGGADRSAPTRRSSKRWMRFPPAPQRCSRRWTSTPDTMATACTWSSADPTADSDPVTFAALVERAEHIAAGLAERGLGAGSEARR